MTDYKKLIEALNRLWQVQDTDLEYWVYGSQQAMHDAAAAIEALQAQLPKRGEWVYNDGDYIPYCSICGMPQDTETPYCHFCGAKMEVQDGE